MKAYLVDVGVLLAKDDAAYDEYSGVYDGEYGYYDEDQFYVAANMESNIQTIREYVESGVDGTYGILSNSCLEYNDTMTDDDLNCVPLVSETYAVDDVVYSVAKINGEIVENFIKK